MKTIGVIIITIVVISVLLPIMINFLDWVHALLNDSHEDKCMRKLVEQDYKKRNEGIHKQYNSPTEHSIASRRRQQAFNIKRFIGGKLSEWQSPVIDAENAQVQFEMKEDHIAMSVIIPFKSYEFPQH